MAKELSKQHDSLFEKIRQTDEKGNEFWSARDLSKVLEYSEYRHFLPAIERAKEACINSGQQLADHFEDILEMVTIGSGAQRKTESQSNPLRSGQKKHSGIVSTVQRQLGWTHLKTIMYLTNE